MLICPTSSEPFASLYAPFWAEVCRWSASLAGGSSCWGPNEVVVRGSRLTPPPSPQTATKMVSNQRPLRYHPFMGPVTARRSVETHVMKSRELVRGARLNRRGNRLRHPTSAVPRTSGLADVLKV